LGAYDITVDASGNGDYTTVQGAIDNAASGDSIFIAPGTYTETVVVDLPLKFYGAGQDATVITRATGGNTITINDAVGSVEFHSMTIENQGSSSGDDVIDMGSNDHFSVIKNVEITGGYIGIDWGNSNHARRILVVNQPQLFQYMSLVL